MTDTPITLAHLAKIKKAAKAAKTTHPDLSHAQRLDMLAAAEYGVRHFHELQKRYEEHISTHIARDGRTYHCRFCDFTFDGGLTQDIKTHRERHQNFEEALSTLGFLPSQYREREQIKRLGYGWMHSSNEHTQRDGALAVLLSYFERSLERAIEGGYWFRHAYFNEYMSCALPEADFIPQTIRQRLAKEVGERPGIMPAGTTDWPAKTARTARPSPAEKIRINQIRATVLRAITAEQEA